ncbi:metallophosphoesterase family protein [Qipengyuania sp. ASV99]|uniref:metallophosphoesterase family protein n=1 Tax=Qipengyuania sp. ASV99 TaxID=3399681 RepID=UPI003A4C828C
MTTRLFHVSDIHFGAENRAALASVERAISAETPDALICTGDLTQRAKHSEYAAAAAWFEGLGVPVVLEPGNHDMPYYNLFERFADPYRRYRRLARRVVSPFESEDVVLVSLRTTVRAQRRFPWSDGVVTPRALSTTLKRLACLRSDPRHVIVTAHHPLLGPEGKARNPTIRGNRAFAAIAEAGADAVLTGHVHVPFDELRESGGHSARMIGAGTLSTRLRGDAPPSYRVITCQRGGAMTTELRELTSALR